jgi:hypothetical protein
MVAPLVSWRSRYGIHHRVFIRTSTPWITICRQHHVQQLTYAVNRIAKRTFVIVCIFEALHREPHRARGVAFLQHFTTTIRALERAFGQAIGLLGPDDAACVRLHRDEALKAVIATMTAIADNSAPRLQEVLRSHGQAPSKNDAA